MENFKTHAGAKALGPIQSWKKTIIKSYNILSVQLLEWPTLTLEMADGIAANSDKMLPVRLLYGTDTNDGERCAEQDFIYISDFPIPSENLEVDTGTYSEETGEAGGTGMLRRRTCRPAVFHKIIHDTEVNVARMCPLNRNIIASRGSGSNVNIFNRSNQPGLGGVVTAIDTFKPNNVFSTDGEGWGLCFKDRRLFSSDSTGCIASWDIELGNSSQSVLRTGVSVNDIKASPLVDNLLAAACEDGTVKLYDAREEIREVMAMHHTSPVNSTSFSAFDRRAVYCGASDGSVLVFDLRSPKTPLASAVGHSGSCTFVVSSPMDPGVVVTGGDDGVVKMWRMGEYKGAFRWNSIFTHIGHTGPITGLAVSRDIENLVASSSEDHTIMLWQPNLKNRENNNNSGRDKGRITGCVGVGVSVNPSIAGDSGRKLQRSCPLPLARGPKEEGGERKSNTRLKGNGGNKANGGDEETGKGKEKGTRKVKRRGRERESQQKGKGSSCLDGSAKGSSVDSDGGKEIQPKTTNTNTNTNTESNTEDPKQQE